MSIKENKWEPVLTTEWECHFIEPVIDYTQLEEIKKLWHKHISLKGDEIIINKSIFPMLSKYKTQYFFDKI